MEKEINMELIKQLQNKEIIVKNTNGKEIRKIIKTAFPGSSLNGDGGFYFNNGKNSWGSYSSLAQVQKFNIPIIDSSDFFKPVEILLTNIL